MANEPSLSELTNIQADPERGTGTPAVVLDNSETIRLLNDNARFKAETDWKKYNLFLNNFKEASKDLQDIAGMDVATEDRDALRKEMGAVFQEISKNPRDLFAGGQKMVEIQARLAGLRSKSTESKLNKAFDMAHREYINRNPELNTPENKQRIDSYLKQPLGKRKSYMLNMPTIVDMGKFTSDVLNLPQVSQGVTEMYSDGQYLYDKQGTKYNREQFLNYWNSSLETQADKYGHSYRGYAQQLYDQLPDNQKEQYEKNGGLKKFWSDKGEEVFGSKTDVVSWDKGTIKNDAAAVQRQKAQDRLKQMEYDRDTKEIIEKMKIKGRFDLEDHKSKLKSLSKKDADDKLQKMVDTIVTDGEANGEYQFIDGKMIGRNLRISPATLKLFDVTEGTGATKTVHHPDGIVVTEEGGKKVVKVIFTKGERSSTGNKKLDVDRTQSFSLSEFALRLGKDVFGASGVRKENYSDNPDEENTDDSDDTGDDTGDGGTPAPAPAASSTSTKRVIKWSK